MRQVAEDDSKRPVIAIVGGGASGTLTAVQLLRHAARQQTPLQIVLVDRHARHGLGLAYSTSHRAHLLNTMAFQTSALADDPDHLVRWAGVPAEAFLPRPVYGQYLRETLAEAELQALPCARLTRISSEVLWIRPGQPRLGQSGLGLSGLGQSSRGRPDRAVRLGLTDGWLEADIAVLALGNTIAGLPFAALASDRIIGHPWQPGELDRITDGRPVAVIGTGLTMIDLAIAISSQSPESTIYAVSRHGLLPRPHPGVPPCDRPLWLPAAHTSPRPVRLAELMSQVRGAIAIEKNGWFDVVSALRPYLPDLWHRLPDSDKRAFLSHVARYWEVHRHLVPPPTARRITVLRDTGQLSVLAGRVTDVTENKDQLRVRIAPSGAAADPGRDRNGRARARDLTVGWLVSAAGAIGDIGATDDPLLRDMFVRGVARPDRMRMGLDATTYGALFGASGTASDTLYTLGPPLRGLWYETTSMPEIREQAAALAKRIAADRRISRPGGRAA
jgi:uncharacterized NAD(P)/FAD-binding protein YdhS